MNMLIEVIDIDQYIVSKIYSHSSLSSRKLRLKRCGASDLLLTQMNSLRQSTYSPKQALNCNSVSNVSRSTHQNWKNQRPPPRLQRAKASTLHTLIVVSGYNSFFRFGFASIEVLIMSAPRRRTLVIIVVLVLI
jgi:hypothetical protein